MVEYLIHLQEEVGKENCVCLLGNHEYMAYTDEFLWMRNGGDATTHSYHRNQVPKTVHFPWFRQLPLLYESENVIACHAGLPKPVTSHNTQDDILWDRDWITEQFIPNEKVVVFGHTPSKNGAFRTKNGNVGIDTGCVFGYQLCAMIVASNGMSTMVYEDKNTKD